MWTGWRYDCCEGNRLGPDQIRAEFFHLPQRERSCSAAPNSASGCSKTRKQINRDIYWMSCRQFAHSSSRAGPTAPRGHQKHKSRQPIKQEHAGEIFFGKKKKKGKMFSKTTFSKAMPLLLRLLETTANKQSDRPLWGAHRPPVQMTSHPPGISPATQIKNDFSMKCKYIHCCRSLMMLSTRYEMFLFGISGQFKWRPTRSEWSTKCEILHERTNTRCFRFLKSSLDVMCGMRHHFGHVSSNV